MADTCYAAVVIIIILVVALLLKEWHDGRKP